MNFRLLTFISSFGLIVCFLLQGLPAHCEDKEDTKKTLIVGYTRERFSKIDLKDVEIAIEVWMKKMAARKGIEHEVKALIFDDRESIIEAARNGEIDLINLVPMDYVAVKDEDFLEPFMVSVTGKDILEEYLLLVNKKSGYKDLKQLRGKKIVIDVTNRGNLPVLWLDVILLEEKLPEGDKYFKQITKTHEASLAVMDVFFGKEDACIVIRRSFDTASEMNPQLKEQLEVMRVSPGFVSDMACFRKDYDKESKEMVREESFKMAEYPEGQQVMILFKFSETKPFDPSYFKSVESLMETYKELKKQNR